MVVFEISKKRIDLGAEFLNCDQIQLIMIILFFVVLLRRRDAGDTLNGARARMYACIEHFHSFAWLGEEIPELPPGCLARWVRHRVRVWPTG